MIGSGCLFGGGGVGNFGFGSFFGVGAGGGRGSSSSLRVISAMTLFSLFGGGGLAASCSFANAAALAAATWTKLGAAPEFVAVEGVTGTSAVNLGIDELIAVDEAAMDPDVVADDVEAAKVEVTADVVADDEFAAMDFCNFASALAFAAARASASASF